MVYMSVLPDLLIWSQILKQNGSLLPFVHRLNGSIYKGLAQFALFSVDLARFEPWRLSVLLLRKLKC